MSAARELTGVRIEVGPANRRFGRGGRLDPRPYVRVMVEPGDDDLVAGRPGLGECPRKVVGQLGHAAPEDDAAWISGEQVSHRGARTPDDVVGAALGCSDPAAVGDGRGQRLGDGVGHDLRHLRAAGPVEVGRALGQCGELLADRLNVKPHGARPYIRRTRRRPARPAVLAAQRHIATWAAKTSCRAATRSTSTGSRRGVRGRPWADARG